MRLFVYCFLEKWIISHEIVKQGLKSYLGVVFVPEK
jgi:hypothetical protein